MHENPHDARRGISFKGLFAVAVWGASFAATRIALEGFNPFGLVAVRLVAGAMLLGFLLKLRREPLLPMRGDMPVCLFLGVLVAGHLLIQAYGLRYTSAVNTGWIIGFIPVTIALGAHLFLKQRIRSIGWFGLAVATGGVLLITLSAAPDFEHASFGDVLQLSSCFTWTAYTLIAASVVARNGALRVTTFAMAVAAGVTTVATLATGLFSGPVTQRVILAVAFLGFVCGGLAYYLWLLAQHEQGPTRVGALLYFEPFFTIAAASTFVGERITFATCAAGLLVLAGVRLVAAGRHHPQPTGVRDAAA